MSASVIALCYASEPLLSCGVPNLELHFDAYNDIDRHIINTNVGIFSDKKCEQNEYENTLHEDLGEELNEFYEFNDN